MLQPQQRQRAHTAASEYYKTIKSMSNGSPMSMEQRGFNSRYEQHGQPNSRMVIRSGDGRDANVRFQPKGANININHQMYDGDDDADEGDDDSEDEFEDEDDEHEYENEEEKDNQHIEQQYPQRVQYSQSPYREQYGSGRVNQFNQQVQHRVPQQQQHRFQQQQQQHRVAQRVPHQREHSVGQQLQHRAAQTQRFGRARAQTESVPVRYVSHSSAVQHLHSNSQFPPPPPQIQNSSYIPHQQNLGNISDHANTDSAQMHVDFNDYTRRQLNQQLHQSAVQHERLAER